MYTVDGTLFARENSFFGTVIEHPTWDLYIPEFPYPRITIRMLLNHTSGMPNYYWLVEHHWKNETAPANEDVIKLLAKHKLNLYLVKIL